MSSLADVVSSLKCLLPTSPLSYVCFLCRVVDTSFGVWVLIPPWLFVFQIHPLLFVASNRRSILLVSWSRLVPRGQCVSLRISIWGLPSTPRLGTRGKQSLR